MNFGQRLMGRCRLNVFLLYDERKFLCYFGRGVLRNPSAELFLHFNQRFNDTYPHLEQLFNLLKWILKKKHKKQQQKQQQQTIH